MNEFLIKLRAIFSGTGLSDAEAGLKRVKAAADEASKSTTKATTAPSAAGGAGKMFSPQESKDLARSIMAEATAKAEAAEKALRKVEDQAVETKGALEGEGSGGGGGSFLERLPRIGALALAAIGVGKLAAAQVEKLSAGVKVASDNLKESGKNFQEAANAETVDGAISGLENLLAGADATSAKLKELRQDWGAWTANLLVGGAVFREMEAAAEAQRLGAYSALVGATSRQAGTAADIATDPTNAGRTEAILRANKRAEEMAKLQQALDGAKNGNERISAQNAIDFTKERYAAEDEALGKINALKQSALALELEIKQAKQAGNQVEVERLQWIKNYNAELEKAKATGMPDPYGYARDSANASMPDKAQEWRDFDVAMNKARQEGLARQYAEEDAAREKALADEKAAAKDAADAKIAEAQRASRQQDMELEGRLGASRPGREQRDLERLRDYKNALSQLTEGLTPGTAAWSAAAAKAGEIADNLARAASNQDKLNASASADSPDSTRGGAGRIAAERARAEERAQRLEGFGAYGAAERTRKAAEARAEREAAKELDKMDQRAAPQEDKRGPLERDRDARYAAEQAKRRKGVGEGLMSGGLDQPGEQAMDPATAAANKAVEGMATAQLDASAAALTNAASALTTAAAALQDVGRYSD